MSEDQSKRREMITFRMTSKERLQLLLLARLKGSNQSELLRHLVRKEVESELASQGLE